MAATGAQSRLKQQREQLPLFGASSPASVDALRAEARAAAEAIPDRLRASFARAFVALAIERYWSVSHGARGRELHANHDPPTTKLRREVIDLATQLGTSAATFSTHEAAYFLGSAYATMLPSDLRSKRGVFYTPPPIAEHLLDAVEQAESALNSGQSVRSLNVRGTRTSTVVRR